MNGQKHEHVSQNSLMAKQWWIFCFGSIGGICGECGKWSWKSQGPNHGGLCVPLRNLSFVFMMVGRYWMVLTGKCHDELFALSPSGNCVGWILWVQLEMARSVPRLLLSLRELMQASSRPVGPGRARLALSCALLSAARLYKAQPHHHTPFV